MFIRVTTKKQITTVFTTIIFCIVLMCAVVFRIYSASSEPQPTENAATSTARINYIEDLGYLVDDKVDEQVKKIEIPNVFTDVYEQYNLLQKKAGFDLDKYTGKGAELYTYKLCYNDRDDVFAHLIVYENSVIGGDVSANSVSDGFTMPLTKSNKK